jgi:uncharacterized protein with GYD domain
MAKYLFQASYTSEGLQGLTRDGASSRRSAIETTVGHLGGRLEAFYYAFGEVDAYVLVDLPDNVSANALSLVINRSGMVHLKTIVLMTPEEVDQAIGQHVDYRAPGQ